MSFVENLATVPQRFSVVNLSTNEEVIAQFNPPEFDDDLSNDWNRMGPPGASRQRMHFGFTNNYSVSLELYFSAGSEAEYDEINRAKQHMQSWCYPLAGSQLMPGKGPPRLLATWPHVFSIESYLTRCKIKYQRFAPDGRCTRFVASVQFEDCGEGAITSEQVATSVVVRGESEEASKRGVDLTIQRMISWGY
jgi:hypothetical protein